MLNYPYRGKGIKALEALLDQYQQETLKTFFKKMLRIRLIEEAIAERYSQNQMKTPIHLSIGQEANSVGSCENLSRLDQIFCSHRTHGHYLAKGGDFKAMLSELHSRINGCVGSRGGSMHLLDKEAGVSGSSAIVAGIIPIATGAALAAKQQGSNHLIVAFIGDAAIEEGSFWESLNFAKLKKLPILYFCENNYYSVCSPISNRQSPEVEIRQKVSGFGVKTDVVDGTNVLAVDQIVKQATQLIKSGDGPIFIEAKAYRFRGHHGAKEDSDLGYRSSKELNTWKEVDPVWMLKRALMARKLLTSQEKEEMVDEINLEIKGGFAHAIRSPFPSKEDLLTHTYSGTN